MRKKEKVTPGSKLADLAAVAEALYWGVDSDKALRLLRPLTPAERQEVLRRVDERTEFERKRFEDALSRRVPWRPTLPIRHGDSRRSKHRPR